MRKLLVASQNGGVGKTTTSVNLAAAAAQAGARVLLLDADPVGSIAHLLKLSEHPQRKAFQDLQTPLPGALTCSALPGLDVITPYDGAPCSDEDLEDLLRAATSSPVAEQYDCLILNTPPFLGAKPFQLLSACDELVLVMRADPLATRTLPAFLELINRHSRAGKSIRMKGILLTLPESEEEGSRWEEELRGRCGRRLFPESIPHDSRIEEGEGTGEIAVLNHPDSPGGSSYLRVAAYLELPACAGTHAETNRELPDLLKEVIEAMPRKEEEEEPKPKPARKSKPVRRAKERPRPAAVKPSDNSGKQKSGPRRTLKPNGNKGSNSKRTPTQTQEAPRPLRLRFEPMKKTQRVRKESNQGNGGYAEVYAPSSGEQISTGAEPRTSGAKRRNPDPYSTSSVTIFLVVAMGMGFAIGLVRVITLSLPMIIGILCSVSVLVGYVLFYNQNANEPRRHSSRADIQPTGNVDRTPEASAEPQREQRRSSRNRPSRMTRRPSIRPS